MIKASSLFTAASSTISFDGELRRSGCDSENGNIFGYVCSELEKRDLTWPNPRLTGIPNWA